MTEALLVLEDGSLFKGRSFGARGTAFGEVVFNTAMAGYTEVLTDPSYRGQIVCMTYPLIGNYGITPEDFESRRAWMSGFIIKEQSRIASNFRSRQTLDDFLKEQGLIGIEGIDTRRLVRHIRLQGAMQGAISTEDLDHETLLRKVKAAPSIVGRNLVQEVTCEKAYEWTEPFPGLPPKTPRFKVVAFDYGIKYNILRRLVSAGCQVTVVPASTQAEEVLRHKPDGIFLSNGPGDPAALPEIVREAKQLIGKRPIFGICLGHQILGQALGAKTTKLKFGHHGGNQPVKRLETKTVEITSQNHGFAVTAESLPQDIGEITHINLNDQTVEGLKHKTLPLFSVQYHPEAAPGPHDARYLFQEFIKMMEGAA